MLAILQMKIKVFEHSKWYISCFTPFGDLKIRADFVARFIIVTCLTASWRCCRLAQYRFQIFYFGLKIHNHFFQSGRKYSLCVGCGGEIHDQYILRVAPNLEWHAACLKCSECQMFLDENCTCFVRDGKTYCKKDYVRQVIILCNF